MKRILVVVVAIMLLASTGAFAAKGTGLAVGGEGALYFAGSGGLPMSAMLSLHFPKLPLVFGIGVSNPFAIGVTVDYWIAHGTLVGILDWYGGIGGYLSLNNDNTTVGARVPLALQVWPLGQTLEVFLEVAPAIGISLVPTELEWHLQAALGFRIWF